MKKSVWVVLLAGGLLSPLPLHAEWVSISNGLPDPDIKILAVAAKGRGPLYAASPRRVYRFEGEKKGWKQVLSLRGTDSSIRCLISDPSAPEVLYVASDKGVQKSADGGKSWKWLYRGIGEKGKAVYCVFEDTQDASALWLGTGQGLVRVKKDGSFVQHIASFPATGVYSVWSSASKPFMLADTASGIYKSADGGTHWEKVSLGTEKRAEEEASQPLSQFQIEELRSDPFLSDLVYVPARDRLIASTGRGLFESVGDAAQWKPLSGSQLLAAEVHRLASSPDTFYAATSRGVFQWDAESASFKDLSTGLPSQDVRTVFFDEASGDLYAATKNGIHRFPKPEIKIAGPGSAELKGPSDVMGLFRHEPTVGEVQQAAIHYAEVSPKKIEEWRRAAGRRAWLPTVSLGSDLGEDQNVDLDRGGTNDPDKFIMGPKERSLDWHVDLSWDLGDLIWNGDQTSIDTRSKLMVELRDDILNEVTHLYFERRRLQTELAIAPPVSLPLQIEKELKLQEMTADIDALTGNYLSRRLKEAENVPLG